MHNVLPGDRLVTINGHAIRDIIDYRFYSADNVLDCTFFREEKERWVHFKKAFDQTLGLEFEPFRFQKCTNHCIFCFCDQNPKSVRSPLKFKDEDYRLSFLYGNYVTLTQVGKEDLERIVKQRLSPLYLSIHATDLSVRKRLLGVHRDDHLLEKMEYLTRHAIELHGQIVLCRGINDGVVLENSMAVLSSFYPGLRSVAVVPVGLTKHRQGLPALKGYDSMTAREVVEQIRVFQKRFQKKWGEPFVYLSDEFYLLAGQPLPQTEHYGNFWQVENGVGLTRTFLDDFEKTVKSLPKKLERPKQLTWVTGVLAGPILLQTVLPRLGRIRNLHVDVQIIPNHFFGESITVSGLLTGGDIIDAFRRNPSDALLCLPSNCLNEDGIFLDDLSPLDLEKELNREVIVVQDMKELWKMLM